MYLQFCCGVILLLLLLCFWFNQLPLCFWLLQRSLWLNLLQLLNYFFCSMKVCIYSVAVNTHTHTHTRLTALFLRLPRWAGTRKVKPVWILLKQETVSGCWAICKSAPRSRQITTPAPHCSAFTGPMPFLPPNQQCQSTEGTIKVRDNQIKLCNYAQM